MTAMRNLRWATFAVLALLATAASMAQEAPPTTSPPISWLVEAGALHRMNKLCGQPLGADETRVIADVMLAASVNPHLTDFDGSDDALMQGLRNPTAEKKRLVAQEMELYKQVTTTLQMRFDMEGPAAVCPNDLSQRATAFIRKAHTAKASDTAERLVKIMVRNKCQALGCGG